MEAEFIVYLASALLSLAFEYVPWLAGKYNALANNYQQLIMLGMLILVVGTAFVLGCLGIDSRYMCNQDGLIQAVTNLFAAIAINQGVYQLLPKRR